MFIILVIIQDLAVFYPKIQIEYYVFQVICWENAMKKIVYLLLYFILSAPMQGMELDQATFKVAKSFFDQGLYTEAEPRFLDIVRKYPDSSIYYSSLFYLGQTYAHLGKYKSALQYYKVLLNKSKTIKSKQQALLGVAKSWLQLGAHDKAGDFYAFYASEYPESEYAPAALYFSGIARERGNDISSAVEKYRAVLDLYADSDYYTKAIEKVAVLENNTPESLWEVSRVIQSQQPSQGDANLLEEEFLRSPDPGYESTSFRAQRDVPVFSSLPISPTVVTQLIQSPPTVITQVIPTVITQKIRQVVTQIVEKPVDTSYSLENTSYKTPLTPQREGNKEIEVVYMSNNQIVDVLSSKEQEKQKEIDQYRKLWEEEFFLNLKKQELDKAERDLQAVVQLSDSKAQILDVKEQELLQRQRALQNKLHRGLQLLEPKDKTPELLFDGPPPFLSPSSFPTVVPAPTEESTYKDAVTTDQKDQTEEEVADEYYGTYEYEEYGEDGTYTEDDYAGYEEN